jgi:hypothetical protein
MRTAFGYLIFLVSVVSVCGEATFDALLVAPTEFKFTLNDGPLDVGSQGITMRAVKETIKVTDKDGGVSRHDIAYQAYHLEFVYKLKSIDRRQYDLVEFYDGNDVLYQIDLRQTGRRITTTIGRRYEANFMAINLEGVPLIMLDDVDRVNFRKTK